MSEGIVFATGGTTRKARVVTHKWEDFDFVCSQAAKHLEPLFKTCNPRSVANCMAAGGLWGGFIFVQEVLKIRNLRCYPFGSGCDLEQLANYMVNEKIDTIVALPNFSVRFFLHCQEQGIDISGIKTLFYFGEGFSSEDRKCIPNDIDIHPFAYTTQETGVLGYSCPHTDANTYHLHDHVHGYLGSDDRSFFVDVTFPSGTELKGHNTNDCVNLVENHDCLCGFNGTSIEFVGREENYSNVLGTSISAEEIKRAFDSVVPSSSKQILGIQIISGVRQSRSYVDIFVSGSEMLKEVSIEQLAAENDLVRELYLDADVCRLRNIKTSDFSVNPISGKVNFHIVRNIA
ncbi:hypothetical protein ACKVMW_22705 [Vibrio chagasii]|uniref:hypothetical protein n=1 Tax=Vibrio chagasii TaxID=170679 RepID=UPI000FE30736